jgi:transposase-like protein
MSVIDHRIIINRYQSGEKISRIADDMDIHPQTIYNVLRREKITLRAETKKSKTVKPNPAIMAQIPIERIEDIDKAIITALTLIHTLMAKRLIADKSKCLGVCPTSIDNTKGV